MGFSSMGYRIGDKVGIINKEAAEYGCLGKVSNTTAITTPKLYQIEFFELKYSSKPLTKYFQFNSIMLIGKPFFKQILNDYYE